MEGGILTAVFEVFTAVGDWLVTGVGDLMPMFYSQETGLTLLGVLGIAGLSFSVIFLLIGLIQRFLHFGG